MISNPEVLLREHGLVLPQAAKAVANYVPYVVCGDLVVISGQVCMQEGKIVYAGKVGLDLTLESAQKAAQLCAINVLAQLKQAIDGDWARVVRCVRLGVFVQSDDNFFDQPKVANGASDLMVLALGNAGVHARAAVGVNALPLDSAVEVEAMFQLRG